MLSDDSGDDTRASARPTGGQPDEIEILLLVVSQPLSEPSILHISLLLFRLINKPVTNHSQKQCLPPKTILRKSKVVDQGGMAPSKTTCSNSFSYAALYRRSGRKKIGRVDYSVDTIIEDDDEEEDKEEEKEEEEEMDDDVKLSAYEVERQKRIAKNAAMLASIGIQATLFPSSPSPSFLLCHDHSE